MEQRKNLSDAVKKTIAALLESGRVLDCELKTVAYYERKLRAAVSDFYRGNIDVGTFIGIQIELVEGQFKRAWNEGMRKVGLDPSLDMIPTWEKVLNDRIREEMNHILDFAQAVETAAKEKAPIEPLMLRVSMWSNRYNDVMNLAMVTCGKAIKYMWQLGATELHCSTCNRLHGVVAYAEEWAASGLRPQNAPNPRLECGGWRCQCVLVPTRKYRTRGGIPPV